MSRSVTARLTCSILDNFIYSWSLFQDLARPDELEGRGILMAFFFGIFPDLYHIYHATKMGSAAGSRDNVREAFTCFFLFFFLPSIVHFCLTLFNISFSLFAYILLAVHKPRKELWRSKGVYMLCFFVLF